MAYLFSFLFVGVCALIGQVLYDKTKMTPGHIVSLFVIIGCVLSFFGIYDLISKVAPGGASIMITNYGHLLYTSGLEGLKEGNLLNAIMNMMSSSSATIVFVVFMGFICSLVKRHE